MATHESSFTAERQIEAIEYPGKILNVDKMLDTLGGIKKISQVFCGEQKRLELRYHCENPYNKPICGDSRPRTGILLSVKVRRYKDKSRPPEYDILVLGRCKQVFTFESLADFQYLPLSKITPKSKVDCALDYLKPKSSIDTQYFDKSNVPIACLPTYFARCDTVCNTTNIFRYDPNDDGQHDVLGTAPKAINETRDMVPFNMTDAFPTKPDLQILKRMKIKYVSDEQFQRVKMLFEECPIWTRIALLYESGVSNDKMKCITPSLAYYFTNGPWRMLYVRYGYDPRKDFESRHYQTFDFRLRYKTGVAEFVAARKERLRKQHENNDEGKSNALTQDVNYPYFNEQRLPRSRQCILRYCDLYVPKVQELLEKIPSPLTGAVCNEKTGWLPNGFDAQVRLIISNAVKDLLHAHKRNSAQEDTEEGEPEFHDDDDEDMELQSDDEAYDVNQYLESEANLDDTIEDMQTD